MNRRAQPADNAPSTSHLLGGLFAWGARAALAILFFYSGVVKASDSNQFLVTLAPFTFVPDLWLLPLALGLPWFEILLGLGLLLPWTTRWAAAATALLMVLFIGVLWWALANDIVVSCGCFGEDETPSRSKMVAVIARDAVIGLLAAWLAIRKN